MNHEMPSPAVLPILSTPGTLAYLPANEDGTPVKNQSSVMYYFSQNRTPLSHVQQFSKISRFDTASSGPQLKTPGSTHSDRLAPRVFHSSRTPSSCRGEQPIKLYHNPFEAELVDVLHGPLFSPNVFKTSTPGCGGTVKFQWTIDEIAVLKPADIEEPCLPDAWNLGGINSEIEEQAQRAIDTYFSSHVIVPSPWTDSSKKKPFILPATPGGGSFTDSPMMFSTKSMTQRNDQTPQKPMSTNRDNLAAQLVKRDVASQTTLTLPMDFDLEALLGAHYVYEECETTSVPAIARLGSCQDDEDGTSQDALSNSSLRRKLFFHGDEGTPISPVRRCKNQSDSERVRPLPDNQSPIGTIEAPLCSSGFDFQGSSYFADLLQIDHFSSSPIKVVHTTPSNRRCSAMPLMMESPAFSPIRAEDTASITCGNSRSCAPAVAATVWVDETYQSPELRKPLNHRSRGSIDLPSSCGTGKKRHILSAIDVSFDMNVDDCSGQRQAESEEIIVLALRPETTSSESREPNDDAAVFHMTSNQATVDETASMSQDHVPFDSQNTGSQMASSDTGYQSNFLQMTNNGTRCYSLQHDSVLPSVLATEEMSCDSSYTNPLCAATTGDQEKPDAVISEMKTSTAKESLAELLPMAGTPFTL